MKKREYMHPEMLIVEADNNLVLLAGSVPGIGGDFGEDDDVLAPSSLLTGPGIPGSPSFIFE